MSPEIDFASTGLITDAPAHSLPEGAWSDCLNIRIKDASVQGVNKFEDSFAIHSNYSNGKPYALTQWTAAGSGYLNIAYIIKDVGTDPANPINKGRVFVYSVDSGTTKEITNANAGANFTLDDKYPPQLFTFNGMLICNSATGTPQYISEDSTTSGFLVDIPNWLHYGTTYLADGVTIDNPGVKAIARIMRPFNNRIIAMDFFNDKDTANLLDDEYYPIDFAWSSHILSLNSISSLEWVSSFTNTAGDAFLTQTPGKILDGGQLGDHFIAYKSDSVIRVSETGDSLILSFDNIFEDDGIYANRCFANIGNSQHLVIGNYGVYIHDGQSNKQDIAKGLFQDTMFNLVSTVNKNKSFCFTQTRDKEVWFCFSTAAADNDGGCNLAFVYNYLDQKLHVRTLPDITDVHETEVGGELKIYAVSPSSDTLFTLSATNIVEDGWFIRKSSNLGDDTSIKQLTQVYGQSEKDFKLSVIGSNDKNLVITDPNWATYNKNFDSSKEKVDTRVTGRYLNMKVQIDGDKNPKLTKLQFNLKVGGRR